MAVIMTLYSRWRGAAGGLCGGRHRASDMVSGVGRFLPGVEHSRDREAGWRRRGREGGGRAQIFRSVLVNPFPMATFPDIITTSKIAAIL